MEKDFIMTPWELKQKQSLPLKQKIILSTVRIREWHDHFNGNVYVAFSGGKDSTVLLDLVRRVYPDVPGVFVDTGLEYPEVREFVKGYDNIVVLRPKMSFKEVLEKYGFPVLSKAVATSINRFQVAKDELCKEYRLYGTKNGKKIGNLGVIPEKYHVLAKSGIKVSANCCHVIKKTPVYGYQKKTGGFPYIGMMADESERRKEYYLKFGCNAFEGIKDVQSNPIGFWTEKDIWEYVNTFQLPLSKIYAMGYNRTGCMFCMFGIQLEGCPNRFQLMKKTHPKLWDYCINKLHCGDVMKVLNIPYGDGQQVLDV